VITVAFTKALYYPWIDIRDEAWLKNAMLYWEQILTIVPSSIKKPYITETAKQFADEGSLRPIQVNQNILEIVELKDELLNHLDTPEGMDVLASNENSGSYHAHPNEMRQYEELVEIHPDKLPVEVQEKLRRVGAIFGAQRPGWINVGARFADFYMTLLATHLSENIGAALLTDIAVNCKLANTVKLGAKVTISEFDEHRRPVPFSLAQGILADLVLHSIQIAPDTPVKKILRFRSDHANELALLRTKIAELTRAISSDRTLGQLRQQVEDIYINEVKPEVNSLRKGLTDAKIKWATENFLKISFFSTSSTSLPLALLGLSVSYALLGGAAVSLTASGILYNRERAERLRQNPFSYLLSAERAFP
jgi:hypothetical protein